MRTRLPHLPGDLEPALAQASDGGGVVHAVGPLLLVIRLGPDAGLAGQVGPEVDRRAQRLVAGMTDGDDAAFSRLLGDRRGAGVALDGLDGLEDFAVGTELAEQPRREFGP